MINKIIQIVVFCSVLALGWGCSSDNENGSPTHLAEKPNWQLTLTANDAAPSWSVANAEDYELTMSMAVKLNPVLARYASSDDLLAAFIGGVCRCVTTPTVYTDSGIATLGLTIIGNAGESGVTLKYYCKRLNRIFTLENWINFNPNLSPTQDGAAYVLPFEAEGGMVSARVTVLLPEGSSVDLNAGDEIAVLSDGNQCRSSVSSASDKQIVLDVIAPQGSRLTIDWYSAAKQTIYEAAESLSLTDNAAKTISVSAFQVKK